MASAMEETVARTIAQLRGIPEQESILAVMHALAKTPTQSRHTQVQLLLQAMVTGIQGNDLVIRFEWYLRFSAIQASLPESAPHWREVARDMTTDAITLDILAHLTGFAEIVALNPNASYDTLFILATTCPKQVGKNAVLDLLFLENANAFADLPMRVIQRMARIQTCHQKFKTRYFRMNQHDMESFIRELVDHYEHPGHYRTTAEDNARLTLQGAWAKITELDHGVLSFERCCEELALWIAIEEAKIVASVYTVREPAREYNAEGIQMAVNHIRDLLEDFRDFQEGRR